MGAQAKKAVPEALRDTVPPQDEGIAVAVTEGELTTTETESIVKDGEAHNALLTI